MHLTLGRYYFIASNGENKKQSSYPCINLKQISRKAIFGSKMHMQKLKIRLQESYNSIFYQKSRSYNAPTKLCMDCSENLSAVRIPLA